MGNRKILVYRLVSIVKELCKGVTVKHGYTAKQELLKENLDSEELLLFEGALKAITLLNGFGRQLEKRTLYSSEEDFMNALALVVPKGLQLDGKMLDVHAKLLKEYGRNGFTNTEAQETLKVSRRHLLRLLNPLLLHGLAEKQTLKSGRVKLYVKALVNSKEESYQETFEEGQGDWKDFVGFVEM